MTRSPGEGLQSDIKVLLHKNPNGLSIEEVSTELAISRTTAAKYLSAMEQSGMVESRPYGPAKIFSLSERLPIDNIVSILPHLMLVLNENLIITQVNDSLLTFFHLEKSSLLNQEIQYTSLGSYINESRVELLKCAIDGIPQSLEEDLTFEGKKYYFLIRIIPTIFDQGEKGIVIIFEDISTLKRYQEHLEELVAERTTKLSEINIQLQNEIVQHQDVCYQLEQSQNQYRQLIENSTDIILKYNAEGGLIFHNILAEKTLGVHSTQHKKNNFLGTCIPNKKKNQEYAKTLFSELLSDPLMIKRAEFEYPSPYSLWISWTFHTITSITNNAPEILCIGNEITEHILAEKRLMESKEQLARIIAHLPDPTFVINAERKIVLWNQAMKEMTGITAEQVIGKEKTFFSPFIYGSHRPILSDLIFEPDNEEIKEYFQDLTIVDDFIAAETTGVSKDGKNRLFWVKVTPIRDAKGSIVAVIQSLRDITSRRRLEETLMESECRTRGVLEASKDLIIVINSKHEVVYSNAAYARISGQETDTLYKKSIFDIFLPGNSEEWEIYILSALQTQLSNRVEITGDIGNREIILDIYIIPFYPEHHEELYLLIDMRDITALKEKGAPLWEEEGTLQEIGRQVSKIIPRINFRGSFVPLALIAVVLIAFTGNYI